MINPTSKLFRDAIAITGRPSKDFRVRLGPGEEVERQAELVWHNGESSWAWRADCTVRLGNPRIDFDCIDDETAEARWERHFRVRLEGKSAYVTGGGPADPTYVAFFRVDRDVSLYALCQHIADAPTYLECLMKALVKIGKETPDA